MVNTHLERSASDRDELICLCAGVTRGQLHDAIDSDSSATLVSLGKQLGCGLQCGCCKPVVQEMLGQTPWHEVSTCERVVLTTANAENRIIGLQMQLDTHQPFPRAQPGQHVVVQAWHNGSWITRTYTVIDQSEDGHLLSIAIRRVPGGAFSTLVADADDADLGELRLRVATPDGMAIALADQPVVCFVGGVGITPALSLLRALPSQHTVHVDYSARSRQDMIHVERLLQAQHDGALTVHLRETGANGAITANDVRQTVLKHPQARFVVCGPEPYNKAVIKALGNAGVPAERIQLESFFVRDAAPRALPLRWFAYAAGIVLAVGTFALTAPALSQRVPAYGHVNGHETLECADCHRPAAGTMRQQLQAKVHYQLGMRQSDVSFGKQPVDNAVCTDCHANPDDRHPAFRFLEPRFAEARDEFAPQTCTSCHQEHRDMRVTRLDTQFCASCHQETVIANDPTTPSHAELIGNQRWDTCLACHDYHGNHAFKPPEHIDQSITPETLRDYLRGGESPYGSRLRQAGTRNLEQAP